VFKVLAYYKKGDVIEELSREYVIDGRRIPKVIKADRDYVYVQALGFVSVEDVYKEIERAKEEKKWNLK